MCPIQMEHHKFLRHLPHIKKGEKRGQGVPELLPNILIQGAPVSWPVAIHYQRADTLCIFNATHRQMCKKPAAFFLVPPSVFTYIWLILSAMHTQRIYIVF